MSKKDPSRLSESLGGAKNPKPDALRGNVLNKDDKRLEQDKKLNEMERK